MDVRVYSSKSAGTAPRGRAGIGSRAHLISAEAASSGPRGAQPLSMH